MKVDSSAFSKADGALKGLRNGFLKIAAIGSGVAVVLRSIAEGTADQAREIQRAARITGMGTDALQGLQYAAKISGVSAEELQHGLIHLARSAMEATTSGGTAGYAYQMLGIKVANASGKLRPLNDLFSEVAGKLQKMPDGTQKAALAMQLFGRAGAQLIPLLDQGPEGLARFTEEAKRLGIIMDEKTLAAGNRYRISLDRMNGAIQGLKNAISERLFPALTRSTEAFTKWISAHRRWIALHVEKAFEVVAQVLHGFLDVGLSVVNLFERIWKSGRLGKDVLIGLGIAASVVIAPWMSLIAVLALLADDVEAYFEGRNSITGLIVKAFKKLSKEVDKIGLGQVFTNALDEAKKFFTYMDSRLAQKMGSNGTGHTSGDKDSIWEQVKDWVRSAIVEQDNAVRADRGLPPLSEDEMPNPANWFGGRPAFVGIPGSNIGYTRTLSGIPSGPNGGGLPAGSYVPYVRDIIVNVTAGPGTDGTQVGQDIGKAVVPIVREEHARILREAAAATNKKNVP